MVKVINMMLNHVALTCSSEKKCDLFYKEVLGLNMIRSFMVPPELVKNLFGLDGECKVLDYGNDRLKFEIFLAEGKKIQKKFDHVCLEVEDKKALIKRCAEMNVDMIELPKGKNDIYLFIKDFDGNLFEVKEKT